MRPTLAGVVGDPIAQSKSPLIHNYWLREYGIRGIYAPFHVAMDGFSVWVTAAQQIGVSGVNVTKPHKEAAFQAADVVTEVAKRTRSVNTLSIQDDGTKVGDSTDGYGFLENLRDAGLTSLSGLRIAILGAGGAARPVIDALAAGGAEEIRVANRTQVRAEATREFGPQVTVWPWPVGRSFFEGCGLLVNATSLGMAGEPPLDLDLPPLDASIIATDLVYAPLETPFLVAARAEGATCLDGLGMLLHQARPGFARWFGVEPAVTPELRAIVLGRTGFIP